MPRNGDPTAGDLVRGAVAELAAVGQADFTMDGVAQRAYYSVGALYERWHDREELLAAVGRDPVSTGLTEELSQAGDAAEALTWIFDAGRPHIALVGEILLAGVTMPRVAPVSLALWGRLTDGLQRLLPESMAWLMATYAVGNALMDAVGLPGPEQTEGRVRWLAESCDSPRAPSDHPSVSGLSDASHSPTVPAPTRSDPISLALVDAARDLLAQQGAEGASVRRISATAGVTTGAIYRRYRGKAALLDDVLRAELQPERYAWSADLVRAFAGDGPFCAAAEVMTRRLVTTAGDHAAQRVLLQLGVAARNDAELRAQLQERVLAAHQVRCAMFARLADAGFMRQDVDPGVFAWGFQTVPVGMRVTGLLGVPMDEELVGESLRRILTTSAR